MSNRRAFWAALTFIIIVIAVGYVGFLGLSVLTSGSIFSLIPKNEINDGVNPNDSSTVFPERSLIFEPNCRFGITTPYKFEQSLIDPLFVGSVLNWESFPPESLSSSIDFVRVLRVRDDLYHEALAELPLLLEDSNSDYWEIGNEPDTTYEVQDNVSAELYAERFFELATIIRDTDPSAKIGFGTLVQATPIRLRYLQRAWDYLIELSGGKENASSLIDFWNIHAFILNEWPGEWGAGVPIGFEDDYGDAVQFPDPPYLETHSNVLFEARVKAFRNWMAANGEQEKELWLTEYGSLFPPIDPPEGRDLINVSDEETARFMIVSFDYLVNAINPAIGMPTDDFRLVQRWFWYSLNDFRYSFGGSLYDPDNPGSLTYVGEKFADYVANIPVDHKYCQQSD